MGGWFYPRTVKITRTAKPEGFGAQDYQGRQKSSEEVIVRATPASIQANRTSGNPLADLPADASGRGDWVIFCPQLTLSAGIQQNDIVTDEKGVRYNVTMPYWNGFGYKLTCETLKT